MAEWSSMSAIDLPLHIFCHFSDLKVYLPMDAIVDGKTPGTGTTATIGTWLNPAFGKSTST